MSRTKNFTKNDYQPGSVAAALSSLSSLRREAAQLQQGPSRIRALLSVLQTHHKAALLLQDSAWCEGAFSSLSRAVSELPDPGWSFQGSDGPLNAKLLLQK